MLNVSVSLSEQTSNQKRTIQVQHKFDVTEKKQVSHDDGDITCKWEIIDEAKETVSIRAKIIETKNGVENEIAHPLLVVTRGQKGEIKLGEKTKASTGEIEEKSLHLTAIVTQE